MRGTGQQAQSKCDNEPKRKVIARTSLADCAAAWLVAKQHTPFAFALPF